MDTTDKEFKLQYDFTSNEIALLAKFLRDNQDKLPDGLEQFAKAIEDSVYNVLSLDEIRGFFK